MQEKENQLIIESLLFVTPEPLTQKQVNLVFESDSPKISDTVEQLNKKYKIELFRCQDTNFLSINRKMLLELSDLISESDFARTLDDCFHSAVAFDTGMIFVLFLF